VDGPDFLYFFVHHRRLYVDLVLVRCSVTASAVRASMKVVCVPFKVFSFTSYLKFRCVPELFLINVLSTKRSYALDFWLQTNCCRPVNIM